MDTSLITFDNAHEYLYENQSGWQWIVEQTEILGRYRYTFVDNPHTTPHRPIVGIWETTIGILRAHAVERLGERGTIDRVGLKISELSARFSKRKESRHASR